MTDDVWGATRRVRGALMKPERTTRYGRREWEALTPAEREAVERTARTLRVTVKVGGVILPS
jgi:hypothetical protein